MLAVLVTYLNRLFGWDDLEDQSDGRGISTDSTASSHRNKENTTTGFRGAFAGGRTTLASTRILFQNSANNDISTNNQCSHISNSNSIYEQRRQLHRYRPTNSSSVSNQTNSQTDLRPASSTSSLMVTSSSNHHHHMPHHHQPTPVKKKMLKVRADTVSCGMNAGGMRSSSGGMRSSSGGKMSATSESSITSTGGGGNQQSNGLKFPFELWFEGSAGGGTPNKPAEKPKFGKLEFSTYFDTADNSFAVKVIRATDLPVMDLFGLTDPFVKCCLLPDRKRKLETKVKRRTLDPHWNEEFMFQGLSIDKVKHRVLSLQVYDFDRFSRNDPIGDVLLPLRDVQLNQEIFHSMDLVESQGSNKRGELQLSLCYQPLEGILDVAIVKCKNLKPMDINGTSDPYVKIWLLYRGKKVEKKKTFTIKRTLNPQFDEEFTFLTPMNKMRETQLEITVMDYDKIGRNDTIGKVYLGHKSSGLEKQHWKDMLNSARQPVSQWHVLKV